MNKTLRALVLLAIISGVVINSVYASKNMRRSTDPHVDNGILTAGKNWFDRPKITSLSITDGELQSALNNGTPANATTITTVDVGASKQKVTVLTLNRFVLPAIAGAAAAANGALLYTLPAGAQIVKASRINFGVFASNVAAAADTPDCGIGSTKAGGASALLSSAGATTENYLTGQTIDNLTGTVETEAVATTFITDTGATKTIFLNCADTWAAATNLHVNGTVLIEWTHFD
jgi:hypothetical protein